MSAALTSPAAERNRGPILDVLRRVLPPSGLVLEIASGSGEHALYFSRAMPDLQWQPTDANADCLASIAAWRSEAAGAAPNLLPPLALDAADPSGWGGLHADAMLAINLIHIAPWQTAIGLFTGAATVLPAGGRLVLYGPYREAGRTTASSNEAFDADLKMRNPAWGLRDLETVVEEAARHGLQFIERVEMPANNLIVVFQRS